MLGKFIRRHRDSWKQLSHAGKSYSETKRSENHVTVLNFHPLNLYNLLGKFDCSWRSWNNNPDSRCLKHQFLMDVFIVLGTDVIAGVEFNGHYWNAEQCPQFGTMVNRVHLSIVMLQSTTIQRANCGLFWMSLFGNGLSHGVVPSQRKNLGRAH